MTEHDNLFTKYLNGIPDPFVVKHTSPTDRRRPDSDIDEPEYFHVTVQIDGGATEYVRDHIRECSHCRDMIETGMLAMYRSMLDLSHEIGGDQFNMRLQRLPEGVLFQGIEELQGRVLPHMQQINPNITFSEANPDTGELMVSPERPFTIGKEGLAEGYSLAQLVLRASSKRDEPILLAYTVAAIRKGVTAEVIDIFLTGQGV